MTGTHILMTTDAVGGVWTHAIDLARTLAPKGYRITLAVLGPPPCDQDKRAARSVRGLRYIDTGLDLDWLATDADHVVAASSRIARLAREVAADIVHLNSPSLGCAALFDVPVVAMDHGSVGAWWHVMHQGEPPDDVRWRRELTARGLAAADVCVAPSAAYARVVQRCYGLPDLPWIVYNGRDFSRFSPRAMHDFAFTSGRLWDEAKNIALLDRVAEKLAIPFKAAGDTVAPDGKAIDLHHLHALGRLPGERVSEVLGSRPIYVSAARHEPFGLAVLEAAHTGCPLVLSDIPSFRELWSEAALFIPPDDAEGFIGAIHDLAGDVQARLYWGKRARERSRRYGAGAMAARMDAIYRSCLQGRALPHHISMTGAA